MSGDNGRLTVHAGPMFAGKTTALIEQVQEFDDALVFKPAMDDRYVKGENIKIVTHDDATHPAYTVDDSHDGIEHLVSKVEMQRPQIVGIDEAQFFTSGLKTAVKRLVEQGFAVVVAGLDKDFRRDGFGPMPALLQHDDATVIRHTAECDVDDCDAAATLTQRLIDGEPAHYDSPVVEVGGEEMYEARCRQHHVLPGAPQEVAQSR